MLSHLNKKLRLRATLNDLLAARKLIRDCNKAYPSIHTNISDISISINRATELLVAIDNRQEK